VTSCGRPPGSLGIVSEMLKRDTAPAGKVKSSVVFGSRPANRPIPGMPSTVVNKPKKGKILDKVKALFNFSEKFYRKKEAFEGC
jgi:hypothetical protein